jgi:hypothetical protein
MTKIDTSKRQPDWRTQETFVKYMAHIDAGHLDDVCKLCDAPTLEQYTFWRKIPNNYPYDRVTDVHHMLVPNRHTDGDDFSADELAEFKTLCKGDMGKDYNYILQSFPNNMSIPDHMHYHLLKAKHFTE